MQTQGIGRTLRVERERRRVSLDAIARTTMVRRDYLELIDEDMLDRLPPGAYAKGFIRAYASYLGLDPQPYVESYERYVSQPAPELSAVVRHPVRVPDAAGPRAWRYAVGAALGLLLILGLLGAFSSGDEPVASEPIASARTVRALESTVPNPLGAVVRVEARYGSSWVRAESREGIIFEGIIERGEKETFQADDEVELSVGNPVAVRIFANGQDVGSPEGQTAYKGVFTPETDEMPRARTDPGSDAADDQS